MKNFIIYSFIFIFIVLYLEIGIKVISAGLPYSYARDEKTQMARTMNLPINKFDPLQRTKPHFWFYALFSFYSFDYLLGRLTGEFYDKDDYIILYKSFPERIFFTGRLFSLICGIAVLLIFIFWAKKYFNNFLLIFILYLLVLKDLYFYSVSSVLLADMFFVFLYILSTATIYYSVLFKNKKYFFLSAALIGLTVSARQPGIFLFVPLLYGIITSLQENKIKIFFLCCLTAAFIFSITSPYYVLNFYNSFKGIILQFKNLSDTQEFSRLNIVNARGFSIVSYLKHLNVQTSYFGLILLMFSVVVYIKNKNNAKICVFLSSLILFLFMGMFRYGEIRYVLPSILIFYLIISDGISIIFENFIKIRTAVYIILIICLSYQYIDFIKKYNENICSKVLPINIEAKEWIEKNITPGTKIVNDMYPISPPIEDIEEGRYGKYIAYLKKRSLNPYSERFAKRTEYLEKLPGYKIISINYPWNYPEHKYLIIEPIDYYLNNGYNYYILTNKFYELAEINYFFMDNYRNMLKTLETKGKLVKEFKTGKDNFIKIFYYKIER